MFTCMLRRYVSFTGLKLSRQRRRDKYIVPLSVAWPVTAAFGERVPESEAWPSVDAEVTNRVSRAVGDKMCRLQVISDVLSHL